MKDLTVVCDDCDSRVDGRIGIIGKGDRDAGLAENPPVIITEGFYLTEDGVFCDTCIQ